MIAESLYINENKGLYLRVFIVCGCVCACVDVCV